MTNVRDRMLNGRTRANPISRFVEEIPEELTERIEDNPFREGFRQMRHVKQKPVNYFVNETSKPSPALSFAKPKPQTATTAAFQPGDHVRHVTFGVGEIISSKPMGGDILYEINFEKVGTKKLMATYARLTKV